MDGAGCSVTLVRSGDVDVQSKALEEDQFDYEEQTDYYFLVNHQSSANISFSCLLQSVLHYKMNAQLQVKHAQSGITSQEYNRSFPVHPKPHISTCT